MKRAQSKTAKMKECDMRKAPLMTVFEVRCVHEKHCMLRERCTDSTRRPGRETEETEVGDRRGFIILSLPQLRRCAWNALEMSGRSDRANQQPWNECVAKYSTKWGDWWSNSMQPTTQNGLLPPNERTNETQRA